MAELHEVVVTGEGKNEVRCNDDTSVSQDDEFVMILIIITYANICRQEWAPAEVNIAALRNIKKEKHEHHEPARDGVQSLAQHLVCIGHDS